MPMPTDHESLWPDLKRSAEAGAVDELISRIQNVPEEAERVSLARSVIRKLAFEPWHNKDLDVMTAVADWAIAECERLGGDYLQQANVICFNTSANLADCWGDDFRREPRHFVAGLHYAQRALWYRDHIGKGPGARAMATWALGKHQQSLGHLEESLASFHRCLLLEREAAVEAGKPADLSGDAPPGYLIATGYVALLEGDLATLEKLARVLREMCARGGEDKEEADIIEGQLRETGRQLGIEFGH